MKKWDFSKLYPTEDYDVVGEGDNCKVLCSGFYFSQNGDIEYCHRIVAATSLNAYKNYNKNLAGDIVKANLTLFILNKYCKVENAND